MTDDTVLLICLVSLGLLGLALVIVSLGGFEALVTGLLVVSALFVTHVSVRVGPILVADMLFVCAGGLLVFGFLAGRPFSLALVRACWPLVWLLGVLMVGGLIGTLNSDNPAADLAQLGRFALSSVAMLLLVMLWSPSRRQVSFILGAFVLGAVISALSGPLYTTPAFTGSRWIGLAGHPNRLAETSYLAVGIVIGAWFTIRRGRLPLLLAVAILCAGLVGSASRGGFLGAGVMVLVFFTAARKWLHLATVVFLGSIVLLVANPFERSGVAESNAERLGRLASSIDALSQNSFLGSGFGDTRFSHSLYVDVWLAAGLLGVVFLVGYGVVVVKALLRARERADFLALGMASSYCGYLVASAFSPSLWNRYLWLYLALLIAYGSNTANGRLVLAATEAASTEAGRSV